jgi:transposase
VADIESERDPETLREMARLLVRENDRLHERLAALITENARLKGQSEPEQLALELGQLREQVNRLQAQLYGASSEKRAKEFVEAKAPAPQRGHGPTPQTSLRVETEIITLPPEERACPNCDGTLQPIKGLSEDSEQVSVIERQFVLKRFMRQKYRCKCQIGVTTAEAPPKPIVGGRYTLEFAVHVAIEKYLMHQPLDRQRRGMQRLGLEITTQTLWDQIEALAGLWKPVYELLRHYIVGDDVIGVDETWWRLMDGSSSKKQWWVWSLTCPSAVFYRIAPSRAAKLAASLIDGFGGTIVCDGYKAYETLVKDRSDLRLALCWSHARRKFVEAEPHYPVCKHAIELIGKLFEIDRDTADPALLVGDAKLAATEARKRARSERAPPILDELRDWALAQRGLPKSGLRKATDYLLGHWKSLTTFLDDPFVPLHNNRTERALRGVVLGRKNHYGSRSQRGTEVAALFYSILETAVMNDLEPSQYMISASRALLKGAAPQTVLPLASR